jgi:hypothetical protein
MRDVGGTLEAASRVDESESAESCAIGELEDLPPRKEKRDVVTLLLEVFYRGSFMGVRRAELPDAMQRQNAVYTERASVEKALLNAIIEAG